MTPSIVVGAPVLDATHDPERRSWVPAANAPAADFPLQNLPFGVFDDGDGARGGVALGDRVVDLAALLRLGLLKGDAQAAARLAARPTLNALMAEGAAPRIALRQALFDLLSEGGDGSPQAKGVAGGFLLPLSRVRLGLPAAIGGYTDFLTSRHHTERHGRFKGLAQPLPPACLSLPVAYNGRASSVRPSGHQVRRPQGQRRSADGEVVFGPSVSMDFELELGAFVGPGNALGRPVPIDRAWDHLFGLCLLNDWSAKDIQWWEQVLGPFLGKSFVTSISPWVVTPEALAPFRGPATPREASDPALLPHLFSLADLRFGGLDIRLQAHLHTAVLREQGQPPQRISDTQAQASMWTFAQMVAHHTSNGCNLLPGDLLGSGTLSGEADSAMACLTEMTQAGRQPLRLANGEERLWLHDHDDVVLQARASRPGFVPIGFGECRGRIAPAMAPSEET